MKFTFNDLLAKTTKMTVVHPSFGAIGTMDIAGMDTKRFRDQVKKITARRSAQKETLSDFDRLTELEKDNTELAAISIMGWDIEALGEYSEERAKELMAMPELSWIREQVEAFVNERDNFLRSDSEPDEDGNKKGPRARHPKK